MMFFSDKVKKAFLEGEEKAFIEQLELYPSLCDINIDIGNGIYLTPTQMAAKKGWLGALRLLREEFDADIEQVLLDTDHPLELATKLRHASCVNYLLNECNVNPNYVNENTQTPLFIALNLRRDDNGVVIEKEEDSIDLIRMLLAHKSIDMNFEDEDNETPLHIGVRSGHKSGVRLLILAGADLNIMNADEMTPMELAKALNLVDMQNTIESALKEKAERALITKALIEHLPSIWNIKNPTKKLDEEDNSPVNGGCKLHSGPIKLWS